mmetsp:Transcript_27452/g.42723  ORF Transcript_27452/g.42723 Transcript_27452/m.42723 type:complete len:317 (-) Transcript_27452:36-986(-)
MDLSTRFYKRCFPQLHRMFELSHERIVWRKFYSEGCQGKIEGIEGPPVEVNGTEGSSVDSPREQECTLTDTNTACLLPQVHRTYASTYNAGSGSIRISIVTMGGLDLSITGCTVATTIGDVKIMLQDMLFARPDELVLMLRGDIINMVENGRETTIHDLGLDVPGVCLSIVRKQSQESLNQKLASAMESGMDDEARDLIDCGAGFDSEGKPALYMGSTMLHLAVRMRLEDLALFLIKSGADINTENESGRRPLAIAAMKGLGRIVQALLDADADPYHRDKFSHTAKFYGSSKAAVRHAHQNGSFDLLERFCSTYFT